MMMIKSNKITVKCIKNHIERGVEVIVPQNIKKLYLIKEIDHQIPQI